MQYLARQGLAEWGDDDNESNFIQLLRLQSKKFPELTDWLSKKTERYTSHDVQNEIINLMSNQIIKNLLEPVRSCIFLVICDEYKDVSNKERLTLCMCWVNNDLEVLFFIYLEFLEFYEIPDIKSSTIVTVLKVNLDMCRGQCYDGTDNMLGKSSGVATQIFAEQPKAHYTHCHAHSLSLSDKDVTKNTKILRDIMGTTEEIPILIKYSPKQENILGSIKEQIDWENDSDFHANNLLKLSETRWKVRAVCFKRILDNYNVIWNV